ncbi:transglycosylase SLT domain-containing protein [Archangium violaceum]|uniref:lytic transglycosylase domain-containing protein n=1 Tax=Archangium violaceum TaxID=83451 RepID=UPI001950D33E|nr:transglycosylase SLT domain-containing protein [Archangium violaceum]QRO02185.1 transglycosylase SLT domain-containing protein [Archangium violaceum]
MALSPISQNPVACRLPQQDVATPRVGGVVQTPSEALSPRGLEALGLQKDGFSSGPQLGAQWEQFVQGASAIIGALKDLQALQTSELEGVFGKSLGLDSESGLSPFEDSFSPAAELGTELPGASAPASTSGANTVTPSGDARLGAGMPPALAKFKDTIESAASKTGVPASVLAAQIWQESRGNLEAISTNGGNGLTDTGLMQVNPNTYKELQSKYPELQGKNLSDPATNILAGAYYMKDMKEQFGNWDLALRAYNSGPNGVDRSNPNAIPAGTGDATYVQKVKQFADIISTGNGTLPA